MVPEGLRNSGVDTCVCICNKGLAVVNNQEFLKVGEFLDQLSECQLHEEGCAMCRSVFHISTQITSRSPHGIRVSRQFKVPRAEVLFITIHRENIRPSKKRRMLLLTMLPNCQMFVVRM
jgi:hypothetical protein